MARWLDSVAREKLLYDQRREMVELRAEIDRLRLQNERLRTAMRRCLSCEYRVGTQSGREPGPDPV